MVPEARARKLAATWCLACASGCHEEPMWRCPTNDGVGNDWVHRNRDAWHLKAATHVIPHGNPD